MSAPLRPLSDWLLVTRIDNPEKTGSLYVPDVAKEKSPRAKVLRCGPGEVLPSGALRTLDVSPGDVVVMARWEGVEMKVDGEECLLVRERQCLAFIKKEDM